MKVPDLSSWSPVSLARRYIKAHHVTRAALIAAGLAAAIFFFVVGAGVRLLIGPVSLGPFGGTLAAALADALPGVSVKFDQAAIEWTRDEGKVNLVILGARIFNSEGRIIAQAPKADIDLAAGPFLKGKIVIKRIALVGVQLTLVRTAQGGLRLGMEKDKGEHDILSRISDAIAASNGKTASLESFAIRNARLAFFDETTGLFVVAPHADFRLTTVGKNLDATIDAAIEISGHPAHIAAEITFPPGKGKVEGAIAVTGFEIGALAANSKTFAAVKDTLLKVDLSASFSVLGSHLVSADFGASARGAFAVPGSKNGPVHVRNLRAIGRYDGNTKRLLLEDAVIDSDKIKGHLSGSADLTVDDAGTLSRVGANFQIEKLLLAIPGIFAQPVAFPHVDLRCAWLPATRDLLIDHLGISGVPFSMQASGKLTLVRGQSPAVELTGTMAPIGVRDLVHYWPIDGAKGARDWVAANMFTGTAGPATFQVHFLAGALDGPALPADALNVKFALRDGEINYITGLTHLTQVQGTAELTGETFTAQVSSARAGPLTVTAVHFTVPDLNVPDEAGDITGHVQGSMPDVLALVDMPPLHYPTRFGIAPGDAKGTAALDISVHLPLSKSVGIDDVKVGIKAAATNFGISLGPQTRLTDGTVDFDIDNQRLHATGTTGIGGSASRVTLDWTEDFKTANAITTKIAVKGTLDEQARAALNIHIKDYLNGPVGINGTLSGHRGQLKQANMTLDLTPATLSFDLIGINKPAGFPATLHAATTFGAHSSIATEILHANGPGIAVTANATFGDNGSLIQLQAPVIHIGQQDDFSLNLTRNASGVDIVLHGHSIDGSRLATHGNNSSGDNGAAGVDGKVTPPEPFHVSAKLDRMMLREGVVIAPFALDATGIGERPATMSLTGTLSKTGTVTGSIVPTDAGRRVTLATSDLGLFLKGLFGFNSIHGGKLEITATMPGKASDPESKDPNVPDFQGKMVLKDFRVVDQPFLARLFSAGSLGGLINLMQGQGIAVDRLEVPLSSRNGVLSVHDARATGPAIGITAEGYIDRPKNAIALKGSLVPLFGINSVLGNIPLLGDVLTSKQGEGIIGMTYSVTGDADEPSVSVNPLSALAPGIFRRIFEGQMPNASQAPSNNVPKPAPATTAPPDVKSKNQ